MNATRSLAFCVTAVAAIVVAGTIGLSEDPPPDSQETQPVKRVTVDEARQRAKLAFGIYSATLDVIHQRYFRNDRSTIPSKALEEVFDDIDRQENIKARWIVVNARAMSIDHKLKTDFDRNAAKAIAGGKPDYEEIENGTYRRAGAISLMNRGCLGCHLAFGSSAKIDRFAGLVIEIPIKK